MGEFLSALDQLEQAAREALAQADSVPALEEAVSAFVGRKGQLSEIMKQLGSLPADEKPAAGQKANQVKKAILQAVETRRAEISKGTTGGKADTERIDVTAPLSHRSRGSIHPLAQVQAEMERIFLSMGFDIVDGPHIESEFYNFEALNIPADHPAREHQDTFWLKSGLLLRTHTSSVQVRTYLQQSDPPFAFVVPGRVFRYEAVDASHENTFHQMEGFIVDKDISIPNLVAVLRAALRGIFKKDITVRLRPGFFPFVEPGYELDFQCLICSGKGCPVCKRTGWVEFLGCGMIHPNVLRAGKIDPATYTGFAFGMGLDRLTMMLYNITDIRIFQGCDLRVLQQFKCPSIV